MSLFKRKEVTGTPGYAAIVCKSYKFMVAKSVTENNLTVNSISTIGVTLRPLQPGQTPKDLAGTAAPMAMTVGSAENIIGDAPDAQLIHFNAPNWLSVVCAQEGMVYFDLIPVPVFYDTGGKIAGVDVEKFVREQEPNRQRASEIWGYTSGVFAEVHQLVQLPKDILAVGKEVASMPKSWLSSIKGMFKADPPEPIPEAMRVDFAQHPPIAGVSYQDWIGVMEDVRLSRDGLTYADAMAKRGIDPAAWDNANQQWIRRTQTDVKLGTQFGYDQQRIQYELEQQKQK